MFKYNYEILPDALLNLLTWQSDVVRRTTRAACLSYILPLIGLYAYIIIFQ